MFMPILSEYGKPCKHIAAVLFELCQVSGNEHMKYKNSYEAVNAVFKKMEFEGRKLSAVSNEQIHLHPTLYISRLHNGIRAWLELKAGVTRAYVVKSTEEFLDAWINQKSCVLEMNLRLTVESNIFRPGPVGYGHFKGYLFDRPGTELS